MLYVRHFLIVILVCQISCYSQTKINFIKEIPFSNSSNEMTITEGKLSDPFSFDIDLKENIYIPDNISNKIKIFGKDSLCSEFEVRKGVRKIKYDSLKNSLFVLSVYDYLISEYTTIGNLVSEIEIPNGNYLDFFFVDSMFFYFYSNYSFDQNRMEYFLRKQNTNSNAFSDKKLNISINNVLGFQPLIYYEKRAFYIPADSSVIKFDENGEILKTYKVSHLTGVDGIIKLHNEQGYSVSFDGPLIIKNFRLDGNITKELNLVPKLEELVGGKFGNDFMYGLEGYIYDIRYIKNKFYVMGSDKNKVFIIQISI